MRSFHVTIYDIKKLKDGRRRPWRVRWIVETNEFVKHFTTKALADSFRNELVSAANAGEPFDTQTGLPASRTRTKAQTTCLQLMRQYTTSKWPRLAAKSRRSTVEGLVTLAVELTRPTPAAPDSTTLRYALYHYAFHPHQRSSQQPEEYLAAVAWLEKASLPVAELESPELIRKVLDRLALNLDGRPAAATTVARKRGVFYNWLGHTVEKGLLTVNPLDRIQWTKPEVGEAIDRRVVANPTQVTQLLEAVESLGHRARRVKAFFGCLYYAGTRPSEAANLHLDDCQLPGRCLDCTATFDNLLHPEPGGCRHDNTEPLWGRIHLAETNPYAGSRWTDDGQPHQRRGLKHRPRTHTRPVPAPPPLVGLIVEHVHEHGVAADGRLFRGIHGGPLATSLYERWWRLARHRAFTPAQVASPLARRPYDLRHAAASLWLNAGVPATEVARRLGQGLAVLLRIYANCIDGGDDDNNQRIGTALS